MNIIIPLGGKGKRFSECGFDEPKPLINIIDKCMIDYVIDNLTIDEQDNFFIIYNKELEEHKFTKHIKEKYSFIKLIEIEDTRGAAETLFLGLTHILKHFSFHEKCLIIDCDTFYVEDIVTISKNALNNTIFYTKVYNEKPIYSYIELTLYKMVVNIKEKEKISDNANTGAYMFNNIRMLHKYCKAVIDNNIMFKGEFYTSCVIAEMIKNTYIFRGYELKQDTVFSLGTPQDINKFITNSF